MIASKRVSPADVLKPKKIKISDIQKKIIPNIRHPVFFCIESPFSLLAIYITTLLNFCKKVNLLV